MQRKHHDTKRQKNKEDTGLCNQPISQYCSNKKQYSRENYAEVIYLKQFVHY